MNLDKKELDELLDEVSKPAFEDMIRTLKALEKADPYVPFDIERVEIDYQHRVFMNKTEEKLLRLLKDFKYTREQAAILLIDEREIYRKVAKKYLEELDNEQI